MTSLTLPHSSIRCLAGCLLGITVLAAADQTAPPFTIGVFGIGGDSRTNATAEAHAKWIPQMRAIGVDSLRSISVGFSEGALAPADQRDWSTIDAQVAYLDAQGMTYGGLLNGCPKSLRPAGGAHLPSDHLAEWSAYVAATVAHLKGKVHFWEIWNEPPNFTGKEQTPEDYAKIVAAAYDAAKAADPTCKVGLAAKSAHIIYLDQVIQAGAKGHYDYVTLHPYELLGLVMNRPGSEAVFMAIVPRLRRMLAARDPTKVGVPVIFTELGSDAGKKGEAWQAVSLVKAYTMSIAQGVTCINWFEGIDGDSGPMGLLQGDGRPRLSYTAMGQMIAHLGQHPTYLGYEVTADDCYRFVFIGSGGPVMVTWASRDTPLGEVFAGASLIDPLSGKSFTGTALTRSPVLVVNPPAALVKSAVDNQAKPFPWGGDYGAATAISVEMGATNSEQGLHTKSADSIAADVLAYGGSARSGTIPGGNVFMVDPNFLSYDAVPIEISVEVRRDEANHPSFLELEYESATGYTKLARVEVAEGDWQTATWRLKDAHFVSTWGFNFRLNQGAYVMRRVTVTKVK